MKKWFILLGLLALLAAPAALALEEADIDAAQTLMEAKLAALLDQAQEPWQKAMLADARIDTVKPGKQSVTFTLSWPAMKNALTRAYKDGEDAAAYLAAALGSDARLTAQVNLAVVWKEGAASARWSQNNSPEKFLRKMETAAARAKRSYETAAFLKGLRAWCLPESAPAHKKQPARFPQKRTAAFTAYRAEAEHSPELWAAWLYTVKNARLDMAGGPAEAKLTFTAAPPEALMADALAAALEGLQSADGAPNLSRGELARRLLAAAQARCLDYRHQKALGEPCALALDLTALSNRPVAAAQWLAAYDAAWAQALDALAAAAAQMPPHSPVPEPETACLAGGASGTLVTLVNEGATGVYVKAEAQAHPAALCYLRSGGRLTLALPRGDYVLKIASGPQWYGETWLFGEAGTYLWGRLEVDSGAYAHTLTLFPQTPGDWMVYTLPFSQF